MNCTTPALTRPAQYLHPPFKAYIIQHLLELLTQKDTRPAMQAIKSTAASSRHSHVHKKRPRAAKMRTEWDELPLMDNTFNSHAYSNSAYRYISSKY